MSQTNRQGCRWSGALLAGVLAGCGSPLIEPGPTMRIAPSGPPPLIEPAPVPTPPVPQSPAGLDGVPRVPAGTVFSPGGGVGGFYHEVARGETLSGIARQHGTTVARLLDANGLDAASVLQPGQLVFVPH